MVERGDKKIGVRGSKFRLELPPTYGIILNFYNSTLVED